MSGGTQLHAYFYLRSQHAFHKLLEASHGQPSSGGRSLNKPSPLSSTNRLEAVDVNARDSLGRTVLHLAASSSDASAPEYVRMLLAHPSINPNLQDYESHWTALHRALYAGNVASALLLLQRTDVDSNLKDLEGYRAFDLYNSTVHGTKPEASTRTDLYTWGANRNAALGLGDGDDRSFPDQVVVERVPKVADQDSLDGRFEPVRVNQVVMGKLHTAVVTNEPRANVRACGFGSGGRLGHANHTQYTLLPLPLSLSATPTLSATPSHGSVIRTLSLALGQDHTLVLTSTGEVYSWGLNRFTQLGYVIDPPSVLGASRHQQEDASMVQSTPRKVTATLKGKFIVGVAACRTASVCWSRDEVWTWGTNGGQLGYDKSAQPTQVLPRKVTKVILPVLQTSITETAMACLLESHDVICIFNDATFKINFPTQTFPSSMPTYRPPQAVRNASIKKVTASSGGEGFAALSENGELFLCALNMREGTQQHPGREGQVKVQRVWALRKQFSAVKDVEVGVDGSIIICTESGHVFIRSRNLNLSNISSPAVNASLLSSTNPNAKALKFQRVPYIQRAIRVCANSLGAFGALRVDADPTALGPGHGLQVSGAIIQESLKHVRSWLAFDEEFGGRLVLGSEPGSRRPSAVNGFEATGGDEDEEDEAILGDISELKKLCEVLERHRLMQKDPSAVTSSDIQLFEPPASGKWFNATSLATPSTAFGADLVIHVKSFQFPAHQVLLATRSTVLRAILEGTETESATEGKVRVTLLPSPVPFKKGLTGRHSAAPWHHPTHLSFYGVHPLTVLILLTYIYTDELLTFWDPRIVPLIARRLQAIAMDVKPMQVRGELQSLARVLGINDAFARALEGNVKRQLEPRLASDLIALSIDAQESFSGQSVMSKSLAPDVILMLADIQVPCHSTILRSRSPFFQAFFDDEDWTSERWTAEGTIKIDLRHMDWKVGRFLVWYLYGGDVEMFERMEFVSSVDELVEFMFDVVAAANELLLDRLVLICSSIILKRVTVSNACSILAEATHFYVPSLICQIQRYISINLETLLESRMLEDLSADLIKQLSAYIRSEQEMKSPVSRSEQLTKKALETNKDWLALQDIPVPILRSSRIEGKSSVKLSPPGPGRKKDRSGVGLMTSPPPSPAVRPQIEARSPQLPAEASTTEGEMFMMDDTVPTLALDQGNGSLPQVTKVGGGWKVATTPKVDMKVIMAEAETVKTPAMRSVPTTPPPPRHENIKPADASNWRGSQRQESGAIVRAPSGSSPWRLPSASNVGAANNPLQTPPTTPVMRPVRSKDDLTQALKLVQSDSRRDPSTPPRLPGMGPIFTPKKTNSPSKPTTSPGFRRILSGASGSAWTLPPVQPIVQPSTLEGTPMSFAAIQQLQREQDTLPAKDKRSLKQIQEEERAKQVEADFLKWWTAEEERMMLEQAAASGATSVNQRPKREKAKGRGKTPGGRKPPQTQGTQSGDVQAGGSQPPLRSAGGGQKRKGRPGNPRPQKDTLSISVQQES